jgi:hypothetical protein
VQEGIAGDSRHFLQFSATVRGPDETSYRLLNEEPDVGCLVAVSCAVPFGLVMVFDKVGDLLYSRDVVGDG